MSIIWYVIYNYYVLYKQAFANAGGFEGRGHRLGGKEHPMKFGDPQTMSRYVADSGTSCVSTCTCMYVHLQVQL